MALCPQHTFQLLTKRSARMREYLTDPVVDGRILLQVHRYLPRDWKNQATSCWGHARIDDEADTWHLDSPLPNVWLGVSAERQAEADERVPDLLATPAVIRFVSAEPLLGPVNFRRIRIAPDHHTIIDALDGYAIADSISGTGQERTMLDWIIVGGESGPCARPMHPDWARSIRDQCVRAGVPFFFKQWGEFGPAFRADLRPTGLPWSGDAQRAVARGIATVEQATRRMGKRHAGRFLDGVEHNGMPAPREVPFS
jgi:protein gp37